MPVLKIKPSGQYEKKCFYETIAEIQQLIMTTLEHTTEDVEHRGDKYWEKNGIHKELMLQLNIFMKGVNIDIYDCYLIIFLHFKKV
ncbi:hypothetical protein GCM10020331_023140 [Ectobacillus funiculus]